MQEFLGDHYGANERYNVVVRETDIAGRYMDAVVANCRFHVALINKRKDSSGLRIQRGYLQIVQQRVWLVKGH